MNELRIKGKFPPKRRASFAKFKVGNFLRSGSKKFKERSEKDKFSTPDSSLLGNPKPYDIEAFISGVDKLEMTEPSLNSTIEWTTC